jgi:hypothetical protein
LVISGAGCYSDAWHRFGETSQRLAGIINGLGHQVTVSEAVEETLAEPGEADLIVVNIGNPREARPQSASTLRRGDSTAIWSGVVGCSVFMSAPRR